MEEYERPLQSSNHFGEPNETKVMVPKAVSAVVCGCCCLLLLSFAVIVVTIKCGLLLLSLGE